MLTDEELVRKIRQGDMAAFDALYQRYSPRLFSYIRRLVRQRELAEDIFQDVFMSVLRDQRFVLREGSFGGWLFTVARNRCLTQLRSRKRVSEKTRPLDEREPADELSITPEEHLHGRQQVESLQQALAALSPIHQDTFILKQIGNLSYEEIAGIQGVPVGTVKSRLHSAVKGVLRWLEHQGGPR